MAKLRGTLRRVDSETGKQIGPTIDIEAEERESARLTLPDFVESYEATGNPVYAWEAFLSAQIAGVETPASVLAYLRRCAYRVHELATWGREVERIEEKTKDGGTVIRRKARIPSKGLIKPAIAEAFEFVKPGRNGATNSLRALRDSAHGASIATHVYFKLRQNPKLKLALEDVASEHPAKCSNDPPCKTLDVRTVRRYWRAYFGSSRDVTNSR